MFKIEGGDRGFKGEEDAVQPGPGEPALALRPQPLTNFSLEHGGVPHRYRCRERGGHNLNGFQEFRTENASSQGHDLALTGLFVPNSLVARW